MAQVLFPGARFTDSNGEPINGGKLYIYEAGTTTPLDVYTDSALSVAAANPVELDSGGLIPVRYISADDYKFVLESSDNTIVYWTIDNLTVVSSTASSVALRSAENKTANFTVTSADTGKMFTCDTSGGSINVTAEGGTLGNGFWFSVQKTSASNNLVVAPDGGETINGASDYTITSNYGTATFVSLGASGWAIATASATDSVTEARILGRASGAGAGQTQQLTGTQAAVIIDAFTGDSGSGGVKGQVPAPASGDAAANRFLKADGTWKRAGTWTELNETVLSSGTQVSVTGIDSQYSEFMLILDRVSPAGSVFMSLELGDSGGYETTGYNGIGNTASLVAASTFTGILRVHSTDGLTWVADGYFEYTNSGTEQNMFFVKTLSATLDRIRIVIDSSSFDAGTYRLWAR